MKTSSTFASPKFILSIFLLSAAMLLGGGQGNLGDSLLQITAVALLVVLYRDNPALNTWPKASVWALLPLLAVLFFLLHWPSFLRESGMARQQLATLLQPIIGDLPVQGSLTPMASERALFWLLPAVALYLAVLQMSFRKKKILVVVLLFWVLIGAVLGLGQKAGGELSALYFFENTNRGSAVGLFANNNHYAIALAASLPLVWSALVWLFNRRILKPVNPLWFVLFAGVAILSILGFMLSGSRAGLVLGMLGCLLMLPASIAADRHQGVKHWLLAVMAIGLFLSVQLGLYFISLQFVSDPLEDIRLSIYPLVREAAAQMAPMGSGPGSFWFTFPHYGGLLAGNLIINHAHNDYLELWLEFRWLFLITGIPLLLAFTWQSLRVWFRGHVYYPDSLLLARAASVGILLLILHSSIDYPLRTSALLVMTGLLAALLARPEKLPETQNQE